jgi:iron complex transport system ATP-binding protein
MIEAENIRIRLKSRLVLEDVSVKCPRGTLTAVMGQNGAGKSTLLKALAGLIPCEAGWVRIGGKPLSAMPARLRAGHIAWLMQARPVAWNMFAEDVVLLGRLRDGAPPYPEASAGLAHAVQDALSRTGAAHLFGRRMAELSGGEAARVHLARIVIADAPVWLLDEPAAGLDLAQQLDLFSLLKAEAASGRTIVVSTHDLHHADVCDCVIVLHAGRVRTQGEPAHTLDSSCLAQVFGVHRSPDGRLERVA